MLTIQTFSSINITKLKKIACLLFNNIIYPQIIELHGEIGTGKTQFTKFLAESAGIKQKIISPSFIKMNRYPFRNNFFTHLDGYFLNQNKIESFIDYLSDDLVIIEWPKIFSPYLKNFSSIKIWFFYETPFLRKIKIEAPELILIKIKTIFNNEKK